MKRWICVGLSLLMLWAAIPMAAAAEVPLTSGSAVLMEKETGQVLYAYNEHKAMPPASVTKIMTVLLVMEAIDSGAISREDTVTVSRYAASMGGSQVYLSEGEKITVHDLLKSVCISSGNDAAVALAEYVSGVTELFVEQMNNRAKELGMDDTHFVNCTGLSAEGHVTSAWDIALMSRELLLHHPQVREYTTIWLDTIRGGTFQLSNTNKLVRYYDGCTGLKTGFTTEAMYCISATAERDGMELIAAVMHGITSDSRNADAKALLNYGFSTCALTHIQPAEPLGTLPVQLGIQDTVPLSLPQEGCVLLTEKSAVANLTQQLTLPETLCAPVSAGQSVGALTVYSGAEPVLTIPVIAAETVEKLSYGGILKQLLRIAIFGE